MKILSYNIEGNMIRVVTDNKDRPEFVYFHDKFSNIEQIEKEINKSILIENALNAKKVNKLTNLTNDLNLKVK